MERNIKIICFYSIGILLLCQQNYCDELSPSTPSLASPSSAYETKDLTTSTIKSTQNSSHDVLQMKTSIISTTTTHTTRLHQVITATSNDEALMDATTSIDGLCLTKDGADESDNYSIKSISGDIIVTIILRHSDNATEIIKFIVNHINEIDLLVHNVTIGVRIVQIQKPQNLLDILDAEIDYLENCVENPFGIFLSNDLWHDELLKGKRFEFKIWSLPASELVKTKKVAQLLNELPLRSNQQNASVELRTDSTNRSLQFQNALKSENLCFKTFPNSAEKIIIYVGNAEFMKSVKFEANESLIIVPFSLKELLLSDIPNHSFITFESEIDPSHLKNHTNSTISPSEFITFASTFLEICKSVNNAIWKNCNRTAAKTKLNLEKCEIFDDLHVPEEILTSDVKQMLKLLQLEALENQMSFSVFEKFTSNTSETSHSVELRKVATTNYVTNVTTVFMSNQGLISLGSLFHCDKPTVMQHSSQNTTQQHHHVDSFELDEKFPPEVNSFDLDDDGEMIENFNWQVRSELWVAIGLTVSTLGILLCIAILTFIIIRICMEDVLEGNPIGSVVVLLALIAQFASFFPFTIEYSGFRHDLHNSNQAIEVFNSMCIIKIFVVSVCYCLTFSLLLSRAIMLASIGSEGGFLSHVNGYIQSIICVFSFMVQLGLSTQLLIMMHANQRHVTCENVYFGNWFWGIIGYDAMLLIMLVLLTPFIFKSQRNYQEGILIVITSVLCLITWSIWIPLSMIDNNFREMMIPLGVQATAWVILAALMVPRCFLIVRSIARSDFTQALPSLTSLAFAQASQFISEPSIYECVNPTMRTRSSDEDGSQIHTNEYLSPSEVPTLPLRGGGGRRNLIEHYNLNFNEMVNPDLPSPNKMTRF